MAIEIIRGMISPRRYETAEAIKKARLYIRFWALKIFI